MKKFYSEPKIQIVDVFSEGMIAASFDAGGHGSDMPWGDGSDAGGRGSNMPLGSNKKSSIWGTEDKNGIWK